MIDFKRPKKEDYDFNDNIEGVRYAKDMNDYADKLEEQLRLYNVVKPSCDYWENNPQISSATSCKNCGKEKWEH